MTIEDSVIEQKNIEKSLKAIHDRKLERDRLIELERIKDEKQILYFFVLLQSLQWSLFYYLD